MAKKMTKTERAKATSERMKKYWAARRMEKAGAKTSEEKEAAPNVTRRVESVRRNTILPLMELKEIVEFCKSNGVLSLHYGNLQLLFKKSLDGPKTISTQRSEFPESTISVVGRVSGASRSAGLQEQSEMMSDELEHLKITDPAAFEQFIQSEDADNGGSQ